MYVCPRLRHTLSHSTKDGAWKAKEQSEEAADGAQVRNSEAAEQSLRDLTHPLQEEEQLARLRASMDLGPRPFQSTPTTSDTRDEIEGGYGGQEGLEDRYATTSGEH